MRIPSVGMGGSSFRDLLDSRLLNYGWSIWDDCLLTRRSSGLVTMSLAWPFCKELISLKDGVSFERNGFRRL